MLDAAFNAFTRTAQRTVLSVAEAAAAVAATYHHAELWGAERLPRGPALLVGNHGIYGYETPVFFYLLHRLTGRYPIGLAERRFFKIPLVRSVLPWLGGLPGTRENALAALREGHHVVCYPGGAREVFKRSHQRYTLRWENRTGFIRVAAEAGVPIVPFAARGVDESFLQLDDPRFCLRLSDDPTYTMPLMVPVPLAQPFRFLLGEPVQPPSLEAGDDEVLAFQERVAGSVQRLLREVQDG
ncbi:MAG TPA: lysophospholipid acyltransferase family protein [Myxococcaceae bacterium]|nr:lysophospholipid acyltransferase family protein [Myxococcaceae bacterium]